MNGHPMKALVDSCSSDSFLRPTVAQRLNLAVWSMSKALSMALVMLNATSPGFVRVHLKHKGQGYPSNH